MVLSYDLLTQEILVAIEQEKHRLVNLPMQLSLLSGFGITYENGHSYLIKEFLTPHPRYFSKKCSFLSEFLLVVGIEIDLENKEIEITCEHNAHGRRIDIFIKVGDDTCIILENKIDAKDQKSQLFDYYNFAKETLKYKESNIYTLYLTLYGNTPTSYSLEASNPEKYKPLQLEKICCISYSTHILEWMKKVRTLLYAQYPHEDIILKSAIEQYILAVEILTKQEENRNRTHQILFDLISQASKESLRKSIECEVHQKELYLPMMKCFELQKLFGGDFIRIIPDTQPRQAVAEDDIFKEEVPYFCGIRFLKHKLIVLFLADRYNQYQITPFELENGNMVLGTFIKQGWQDTNYRGYLQNCLV